MLIDDSLSKTCLEREIITKLRDVYGSGERGSNGNVKVISQKLNIPQSVQWIIQKRDEKGELVS